MRPAILGCCLFAIVLTSALAACATAQPYGDPGMEAARSVAPTTIVPTLAPTTPATAILMATATATASPLPTSTPTPTPVPVPIVDDTVLPRGHLVFSTSRVGEAMESLWFLPATGGLMQVSDTVLPGQWDCGAGPEVVCALVDVAGNLLVASPQAGGVQLLDMGWASLATATGKRNILTAMAPDGTRLAVSADGSLRVYALDRPGWVNSLVLSDTVATAWSPDASELAVVYETGDQQALAIWHGDDGAFRMIALMERIQAPIWSPDGTKLAFDAVGPAVTARAQGGFSDVYVAHGASGEVFNLSEMYLSNRNSDSAGQFSAWAAEWEDDSRTVRYVRGVPGMPPDQVRVRHPLSRRSAATLWPVVDEGLVGIVQLAGADDWRARIVEGSDGLVLQVARGSNGWQDLVDLQFRGAQALQRLSSEVTDPSAATSPGPQLILIAENGLGLADVDRASVERILSVCATCSVERVAWLP